MPLSTYAGNKILDLLFRGVAFTPPTAVWMSLHTADPGLTGANEVSTVDWPAYVRKEPANGGAIGTGFTAAASKAITTAIDLLWPVHDGAASITITHVAFWDASAAGNCLHSDPLVTPKTIAPTDRFVIPAGDGDITAD